MTEQSPPSAALSNISLQPRLGAALGGDAGLGLVHIGPLHVLECEEPRPAVVSGTCMGAMVSATYASDKLDLFGDLAPAL